jgi:hypothetical protein
VDLAGGVVRLSPGRSKTKVGRILPISTPLKAVLTRRAKRRQESDTLVFKRDGVTVRQWKVAWRNASRCGRPFVSRLPPYGGNLIRAVVPEHVAMLLTGHKTRSVFDRYNIVNERELATTLERPAEYVRTTSVTGRMAS